MDVLLGSIVLVGKGVAVCVGDLTGSVELTVLVGIEGLSTVKLFCGIEVPWQESRPRIINTHMIFKILCCDSIQFNHRSTQSTVNLADLALFPAGNAQTR